MATEDQDKAVLLAILSAHGQQFMDSFDFPSNNGPPAKKRKLRSNQGINNSGETEDSKCASEDEEVWHGFGSDVERETESDEDGDEDEDNQFDEGELNRPHLQRSCTELSTAFLS